MTTPIQTISPSAVKLLDMPTGVEGTAPRGAAGPAGPSVVFDGLGSTGAISAGDVAMLVLALQTERLSADQRNEKVSAKADRQAELEAMQKKLEQMAKAAEERAKSEEWGVWSTVLKWVAAAAATAAAIATSWCSGGTSLAVAAVVISIIFASESVVKATMDALVKLKALGEDTAMKILACMGSIEDMVAWAAAEGAFGDKQTGAQVAQAFAAVVGLAKAIVSAVFTGGSSVASIVSAVTDVTAETVRLAKTALEVVLSQLNEQDKPSPEFLLALELIAMALELASAASGALAGGGSKPDKDIGARIAKLAATGVQVAATGARAGTEATGAMADAAAVEADGRAERASARIDEVRALLEQIRAMLDSLLSELEDVRDDSASLLDIHAQQTMIGLAPTRA